MTIATHDARYPQITIGWRLLFARKTRRPDLDVRGFAELIGVSKNTITNYESERTPADRMKPVVLSAWAMATGVDVDWLRNGETPRPNGPGGVEPPDGIEPSTYSLLGARMVHRRAGIGLASKYGTLEFDGEAA